MRSSLHLITLVAGLLFISLLARAQDGIVREAQAAVVDEADPAGDVGVQEAESQESGDRIALETALPFARAAVFGHAAMAAGKPREASASASAGSPSSFDDFLNPSPPREQMHQQRRPKNPRGPLAAGQLPGPTSEEINLALAGLSQATRILESLAVNGGCNGLGGRNTCDLSAFPDCTCATPAEFTQDGRGNCNLGVTKPDLQVWCYVDPSFGHPTHVCPDARESSSRPGSYWSRFACITE